jgi:HEAT repeat protein
LAMIGEPSKGTDERIKEAVSRLYIAFGGNPGLKNRAAQVLSIVCRDKKYEPRIQAAFNRYRSLPRDPLRRHTEIRQPVSDRAWVLYYLARLLGELRDPASSDSLIEALENDPNEAAFGRPGPDTLYVGLLQDEHTPCYRAAAARALGNIRETRASGTLLRVLANLDNAIDTRYASAMALKRIADDANLQAIAKLAIEYPDVSIKKVLLSISRN